MSYNKNVVEEALFQIKNLEETLQENAKGILQSTMSEEIKQLVKESLKEQDEIETPPDEDDDFSDEDDDFSDEDDDFSDEDDDFSDEDDDDGLSMDDDDFSDEDDETIDLTGASDAEVLKVFKAMGDDDGIIVKKEGENIHLKDGEDEYMIHLGESDTEGYDIDAEDYFEVDENLAYDSDLVYELEVDGDLEEGMFGGNEGEFKRRHGHKMGNVDGHYKDYESDDDRVHEVVYEIEMDDDMGMKYDMEEDEDMGMKYDMEEDDDMGMEYYMEEDDDMGMEYGREDINTVMEAVKKSLKSKGVGIGHGPKFKYGQVMNYKTPRQKEGKKMINTGSAKKFSYKDGENLDGEYRPIKKRETKEAVRTNSYTRANKVGNRKGSDQNTNRKEIRVRPNNRVNEEVEILKEKNNEYRKALDVFRTKLNEVAVFNSNLAYATRLFTEHSTTKQEKINILRRFDNVESLKESKNLYRSIKSELNSGSSNSEQKINESIERTVNKTVESGSAVNLIESKTYENPQFLRMKDLMGKIK